jgi:Tfp pilus assembly protein FimT
MNFANSNPSHRNAAWRRLPVEWLERPCQRRTQPILMKKDAEDRMNRMPDWKRENGSASARFHPVNPVHPVKKFCHSRCQRAFTILELLLVVGIIGFMTAMALPHLSGFTKSNAMTAATRQLLDDVSYARQRALVNRSMVCMVFLPPNFWTNDQNQIGQNTFSNSQMTSLVGHQYSAYALISTRTVGDQPGISNAHYLTDWKFLPQGVYIYPFQLTNGLGTNWVITTNTTTGLTNYWPVVAFTNNILFPFPSTFTATANSNNLPFIGFTASGQLTAGSDQFIMVDSGSIFFPLDANGNPQWQTGSPNAPLPVETPPGNAFSNPNLIHIDWVTGRARLERNQF